MYSNAESSAQVNGSFSEVTLGIHQGSVMSLLFIIVMEASAIEFRIIWPWEILFYGDLAIASDSLEDRNNRLAAWETSLESHVLHVNFDKIKSYKVIQSTLVMYVPLVLVLTPSYALRVICGFIISVRE